MKFRVRSLVTGKKYKCSFGEELVLKSDGRLVTQCRDCLDEEFSLLGGYVLEFAFSRDSKGKWVWSECVVSD